MGNIFDIKHFAVHDGPGIRTTVFFKGCPLRCLWCHNPEGLSARPQLALFAEKCTGCTSCAQVCPAQVHSFQNGTHHIDRARCVACGKCETACFPGALTLYGRENTPEALLPELLEDRDFYGSTGGVTLSGGECLMQPDFALALLRALKAEGIHTAVDTCGDVPQTALEVVLPYADLFLYDLKAVDPDVHLRCTGRPNQRILDNLRYLDRQQKPVEIRIPFVPGCNDGEIASMADFLSTLTCLTGVRVLAYHNYAGSKYDALSLENTLPPRLPTPEELAAAKALLRSRGLPVKD